MLDWAALQDRVDDGDDLDESETEKYSRLANIIILVWKRVFPAVNRGNRRISTLVIEIENLANGSAQAMAVYKKLDREGVIDKLQPAEKEPIEKSPEKEKMDEKKYLEKRLAEQKEQQEKRRQEEEKRLQEKEKQRQEEEKRRQEKEKQRQEKEKRPQEEDDSYEDTDEDMDEDDEAPPVTPVKPKTPAKQKTPVKPQSPAKRKPKIVRREKRVPRELTKEDVLANNAEQFYKDELQRLARAFNIKISGSDTKAQILDKIKSYLTQRVGSEAKAKANRRKKVTPLPEEDQLIDLLQLYDGLYNQYLAYKDEKNANRIEARMNEVRQKLDDLTAGISQPVEQKTTQPKEQSLYKRDMAGALDSPSGPQDSPVREMGGAPGPTNIMFIPSGVNVSGSSIASSKSGSSSTGKIFAQSSPSRETASGNRISILERQLQTAREELRKTQETNAIELDSVENFFKSADKIYAERETLIEDMVKRITQYEDAIEKYKEDIDKQEKKLEKANEEIKKLKKDIEREQREKGIFSKNVATLEENLRNKQAQMTKDASTSFKEKLALQTQINEERAKLEAAQEEISRQQQLILQVSQEKQEMIDELKRQADQDKNAALAKLTQEQEAKLNQQIEEAKKKDAEINLLKQRVEASDAAKESLRELSESRQGIINQQATKIDEQVKKIESQKETIEQSVEALRKLEQKMFTSEEEAEQIKKLNKSISEEKIKQSESITTLQQQIRELETQIGNITLERDIAQQKLSLSDTQVKIYDESLNKLITSTTQFEDKAGDILDRSVASIHSISEKAQELSNMSQQLLDVSGIGNANDSFRSALDQTLEDQETLIEKVKALNSQVIELETRLQSQDADIISNENIIQLLRRQLSGLNGRIRDFEEDIYKRDIMKLAYEDQITQLKRDISKLEANAKAAGTFGDPKSKELYDQKVSDHKIKTKELEERIAALNSENLQNGREITKLTSEKAELEQNLAEISQITVNQEKASTRMIEEYNSQIVSFQAAQNELREERDTLQDALRRAINERDTARDTARDTTEKDSLYETIGKLQERISQLNGDITTNRQNIITLQQEKQRAETDLRQQISTERIVFANQRREFGRVTQAQSAELTAARERVVALQEELRQALADVARLEGRQPEIRIQYIDREIPGPEREVVRYVADPNRPPIILGNLQPRRAAAPPADNFPANDMQRNSFTFSAQTAPLPRRSDRRRATGPAPVAASPGLLELLENLNNYINSFLAPRAPDGGLRGNTNLIGGVLAGSTWDQIQNALRTQGMRSLNDITSQPDTLNQLMDSTTNEIAITLIRRMKGDGALPLRWRPAEDQEEETILLKNVIELPEQIKRKRSQDKFTYGTIVPAKGTYQIKRQGLKYIAVGEGKKATFNTERDAQYFISAGGWGRKVYGPRIAQVFGVRPKNLSQTVY